MPHPNTSRVVAILHAENCQCAACAERQWKNWHSAQPHAGLFLVVALLAMMMLLGVVWVFAEADSMVAEERARVAELEAALAAPLWCDCSLERAVAEDLAYSNERIAHACAALTWTRDILTLDIAPADIAPAP